MDRYQSREGLADGGPERSAADAPFLPIAARVDQLRASIRAALDKTNGLTRYPQEETPPPASDTAKSIEQASVISEIDLAARDMFQLLSRIDWLNEVIGGRL